MPRSDRLTPWHAKFDRFDSQDRAELDYAWNWFNFHAKQREQVFYFFLVASPFLANAFALFLRDGRYLTAATAALAGSLASCGFLILDKRNRALTHWAEDVLYKIEESKLFGDWQERYKVRHEQKVYRGIRYREEQELKDERRKGNGRLRFWTPIIRHTFVFQYLETLAGLGFAGAAGYAIYESKLEDHTFWTWYTIVALSVTVLGLTTYLSTITKKAPVIGNRPDPPRILKFSDCAAICFILVANLVVAPVGHTLSRNVQAESDTSRAMAISMDALGRSLEDELTAIKELASAVRKQSIGAEKVMTKLDELEERLDRMSYRMVRHTELNRIRANIESVRSQLHELRSSKPHPATSGDVRR